MVEMSDVVGEIPVCDGAVTVNGEESVLRIPVCDEAVTVPVCDDDAVTVPVCSDAVTVGATGA